MRTRLSLVTDRELPEHLLTDTERALTHVGWLGVRRHVSADGTLHAVHLEGFVPSITLSHDGHDHALMLAELCRGWRELGVACALLEGDVVDFDGDAALAAAAVLTELCLLPVPGADFHDAVTRRLSLLDGLPDASLAESATTLTPQSARFVAAAAGPRGAVHVAGILLGLRPF